MENKTFIYGLVDPENGKVRYVGKANNPEKRLKGHVKDAHSYRCANWVKALRRRGLSPQVITLAVVPIDDWQGAERSQIHLYRSLGMADLNLADGGEGWPGGTHSEQSRAKISAALVGRNTWNKGIAHTQETRAKISMALKGKPNSCKGMKGKQASLETQSRMSIAHKGHMVSDETRRRQSVAARGNKANSGRKFTVEHKQKLSAALKRACAVRKGL